ncbi:hypothetical protein [Paraburkholderia aspalathi]|uniref:Uncharacterized protein n=1 Tax=Paraburkholderia aspalathi TaxID=1324617 RepID=A0A1I7B586_9BURK|nr:hypothetical protein [Paraburkholderia aspalathi]SFT82346.1 hypothetical protein SAMN05192563_1004186 [Paraburkholderia aspalathi]
MTPLIVIADVSDAQQMRNAVSVPLRQFNEHRAGPVNPQPLAITLVHPGTEAMPAGYGVTPVLCSFNWGSCLFPNACVAAATAVIDDARRAGSAAPRMCVGAWLDTFSFQARGFQSSSFWEEIHS